MRISEIMILAGVVLLIGLLFFKPRPIPVAATVTISTGGPVQGLTCCGDGRCWPARKNGMCFLTDKPK